MRGECLYHLVGEAGLLAIAGCLHAEPVRHLRLVINVWQRRDTLKTWWCDVHHKVGAGHGIIDIPFEICGKRMLYQPERGHICCMQARASAPMRMSSAQPASCTGFWKINLRVFQSQPP